LHSFVLSSAALSHRQVSKSEVLASHFLAGGRPHLDRLTSNKHHQRRMLFRKAEAGSGMNRPFCSRNVLVLLAAAAVMVFFLASSRRERVNNELTPSYLPKQDADVLRTSSVASSSGSKAQLPKILPPLRKRDDLGYILNDEGFKTGVELGVQKGLYAKVCF